MSCPVCTGDLEPVDAPDVFVCRTCGFFQSGLLPGIGDVRVHASIDEARRNPALASLRQLGFARSLRHIRELCGDRPRPTLLDVGCAHGWFLQAAAERGFDAVGIEPDAVLAAQSRKTRLPVLEGFFPDDLPPGATYDVITFNDVFEHLPDVRAAARSCYLRLSEGGLVAVALPSSRGTIFRTARLLARLGATGPLDRLWQRGFPSPHLSYFHPDNLADLFGQHGFREVLRTQLPSVVLDGLWQRLRYARESSLVASLLMYPLIAAAVPALAVLPPDISFQIFRRREAPAPQGG